MAQVIKSSGEVIETKPANGTDFSLEELQTIVGGYIEVVSLRGGRFICCDEQGILKGKDFNARATYILQTAFAFPTHDFIVGDALVCDEGEIK